jgi:hypothetical protein
LYLFTFFGRNRGGTSTCVPADFRRMAGIGKDCIVTNIDGNFTIKSVKISDSVFKVPTANAERFHERKNKSYFVIIVPVGLYETNTY